MFRTTKRTDPATLVAAASFRSLIREAAMIDKSLWAVSIVSKGKGLKSHAFLILEGMIENQPVFFRSDLFLNLEARRRCSGSIGEAFIRIKETDIKDITALMKDCYYQSYPLTAAQGKQLMEILLKDSAKPLVYNWAGDSSSWSVSTSTSHFHNCASWCVEKLVQIGVEGVKSMTWFPCQIPSEVVIKKIKEAAAAGSTAPASGPRAPGS